LDGQGAHRISPNDPVICNGSSVNDLDWGFPDPIAADHRHLASAADDGIRIWSVPVVGPAENIVIPTAHIVLPDAATAVSFHPTASGLLYASAKGDVHLVDFETSKVRLRIPAGDFVQSFSTRFDGSLTATATKDHSIKIFDPRTSPEKSLEVATAHVGTKPTRILFLGEDPELVSTGFSRSRDRECAIWDMRSLARPLLQEKLDTSPGVITPLYDSDSRLLFLAGRGDTLLRWYDVARSPARLNQGPSPFFASTALAAATIAPKLALDVMACEVVRVLAVTADAGAAAVVPVIGCVRRKSHLDFHLDLFPDTAGDVPALSADEWLAGNNVLRPKASLDPARRASVRTVRASATHGAPSATTPSAPQPQPQAPANATSTRLSAPLAAPVAVTAIASVAPAAAPATPVKTVSASTPAVAKPQSQSPPPPRAVVKNMDVVTEPFAYDLKGLNAGTSNECRGLDASSTLLAFPIQGAGGRLAVWPTASKGRLPAKLPMLVCGADLADFQVSPTDASAVYTLSDAGVVQQWAVDPAALTSAAEFHEPAAAFKAHPGRSTLLYVHPAVSGLLVTAGLEIAETVVKVWDAPAAAASSAAHPEPLLSLPHPDVVFSVAASPDAAVLATIARDRLVRVFDLRSGELKTSGPSHDGSKTARMVWLGDTGHFLTVGFGRANRREARVYNSSDCSSPVISILLDTSPSVLVPYYDADLQLLYLAGQGESSIETYYMDLNKRQMNKVNRAGLAAMQHGTAFIAKTSCNVKAIE
ncbi:Coronin-7, partial [Cladochytrium tenue]